MRSNGPWPTPARADAMAAGAGVTIGSIVRIDEQDHGSPVPRPQPMMMRAAVADAPETPVSAGEIERTEVPHPQVESAEVCSGVTAPLKRLRKTCYGRKIRFIKINFI